VSGWDGQLGTYRRSLTAFVALYLQCAAWIWVISRPQPGFHCVSRIALRMAFALGSEVEIEPDMSLKIFTQEAHGLPVSLPQVPPSSQ
jgi:hypothetical protein